MTGLDVQMTCAGVDYIIATGIAGACLGLAFLCVCAGVMAVRRP